MTIEDYDLLSGAISFLEFDENPYKRVEEIEAGKKTLEKDGFKFELIENEAILTEVSAPMSDIIIPDYVEYNDVKYKVTCINCFFSGDDYKTLVLGTNVKYIRNRCFMGCKMLQDVKLNDCLEVIGAEAFFVTPIKEVIIPDSIKRLDDDAFFGCRYLTVYLPKRLQAEANVSIEFGTPLVERVFKNVAYIIFYDENVDKVLRPLVKMQGIFDYCSHYYFSQPPYYYMLLRNPNWDENTSYYMGYPDMREKLYVIRELVGEEFNNENDPIVASYKSMEEVLLDGWAFDGLENKLS